MAKPKDRVGQPLQPRMSEILAFRTAFPNDTWREIGARCSPPVTPEQSIKYYRSALFRLGKNAGEVGEQLADEHRLAKVRVIEIDKLGQARKFRNAAEWIIDEVNDLTQKDRTELVKKKLPEMITAAKKATEIANLLEGLPTDISEHHDVARMAEVKLKLMKEVERRGLLTQDITPTAIEEGA